MKRMMLGLAACAVLVSAQDWARANFDKSPRHREWVTVTHDGRKVETFVAYPEAAKNTPVIVGLHEIFGMGDWGEEVTGELEAGGYMLISHELLSRMAPKGGGTKEFESVDVGRAIGKLPPDQ